MKPNSAWCCPMVRCVGSPHAVVFSLNNEGKPDRLRGVTADISQRKQAEVAMRDYAEQYRILTTATTDGFWVVDANGRILEANDECCRIYGYRREELLAMSLEDFEIMRNPAEPQAHIREIIQIGHAQFEKHHRCKDGSVVVVEISTIFWPSSGKFLTFVRNITARKQAEAEMVRQRTELAHVSRVSTQGALASSLAHELNQPLSAILSNAQAGSRFLVAVPPDLAEVRGALEDIAQDTKRAGEVIRQMRALVRKDQPTLKPLELNRVIAEVVRLLHSDMLARKVRISPELDPAPGRVNGDSVQLQQVLLNLLLNAFDAMKDAPDHRREVVLRTRRREAGWVQIEVSDWYRPDTYARLKLAGEEVVRNPQGPASSYNPGDDQPQRVQRGGSFLCTDQYCTRYMMGTCGKGDVDTGSDHLGFRCVKAPDADGKETAK